jgi:hypothetical protein
MNPTAANPRLTTRRVDGFKPEEVELLRLADQHGYFWLKTGQHPVIYFEAAGTLQRLGYLWPTQQEKPRERNGTPVSGSFGWKIQDEGRAALAIADARVAA